MKSINCDINHISGWTLTEESIVDLQMNDFVPLNLPLRACGCGVKIDLEHIVYPSLLALNKKIVHQMTNDFVKRRDSFAVKRKIKSVIRKIFNPNSPKLLNEIRDCLFLQKPELVIELYSSSFNLYREFDQLRDQFLSLQEVKINFLINIKKIINKTDPSFNLSFAKGHSIQGEVDFIMLDFVQLGEECITTALLNNDTIITGDSILEPHSLISIFIAFNNALNDLLIYGGFHNIAIYPVYDGNSEQVKIFRSGFEAYKKFWLDRGVKITILDQGPLNLSSHLIGATVTSETTKESPGYERILPGQKILNTHFLGDLGLLSVHRSQFMQQKIDTSISDERIRVLQKLMTPHLLQSKIINNYLPSTGEEFDPDFHISFISDVSGPGLSVLEEAAELSQIDLHINTIKFNNENILNYPRKNYTTSTNGPWLVVGNENVLAKLTAELISSGFNEVHYIGETLSKSQDPKIYVNKELRDYFSVKNFKYDLFEPTISVVSENTKKDIKCPLFRNLATK